ncbi:MAG: spermine synthase [Candidatus Omnitrophica bacterium]|nr:spermine synthase [Candidatus Omnitrophota bacterium]
MWILLVLIIGASGIVAQALLLRELLVSFYGNELTLGLILANWLTLEAAGAFLAGKYTDRIKNNVSLLIFLEILFSISLLLSIYLARTYKIFLAIPLGEGISLAQMFLVSLAILLPCALLHGGTFSVIAKISTEKSATPSESIAKIYSLETAGSIIGGIGLTYLLIPFLNNFQAVFIIGLLNFIACLYFLPRTNRSIKKLILISFTGFLLFGIFIDRLEVESKKMQWRGLNLLDSINSVYGNIAVTKKSNQYSFYYNGLPAITVPFPDKESTEEFANLPLLFHDDPKDVLVIGNGAGGLIDEMLKNQSVRIDYLELDPALIRMLRAYPTQISERELNSPRVTVINQDARFFLNNTTGRYDVILIGLADPSDLNTNRFFTVEFFQLAKEKLKKKGILVLRIPGSLTYLGDELKNLNACILKAINSSFMYKTIIPGNYNIILASMDIKLMSVDASVISQRIALRNIKTATLIPGYIEYRLKPEWKNWFTKNITPARVVMNSDFQPTALFETLSIWNRKFGSNIFNSLFSALKKMHLAPIGAFLCIIFLSSIFLIKIKKSSKFSVNFAIFSTGFFGMLVNLVLLFLFQVSLGYLYYKIGLLISIFMSGIALGSVIFSGKTARGKNPFNLLISVEIAIILFILFLEAISFKLAAKGSTLSFITLFFISGLLLGAEFPLANRIYLQKKALPGKTVSTLYFFDLLGG